MLSKRSTFFRLADEMLHSAQPLYKSFYYFIYSAIMIHAAGYSVSIYLHNYSLKKKNLVSLYRLFLFNAIK